MWYRPLSQTTDSSRGSVARVTTGALGMRACRRPCRPRVGSIAVQPGGAAPSRRESTRPGSPGRRHGSGRRRTKPARSRRCTVRVIEAESVSNSAARSVCRCGPVSQRCMSNSSCPGCRPSPCSNWRIRITCSRVTRIRALLTGPPDAADDDATRARAAGRVTTLTTITLTGRDASARERMPRRLGLSRESGSPETE